MLFLDELVDVMAGALYCATEDEAANMAIMLLETLKMVSRWRYDGEAFGKEVSGKVRRIALVFLVLLYLFSLSCDASVFCMVSARERVFV
jgi:hypothetical protein